MTSNLSPFIGASFRAGGELCPGGVKDVLTYAQMSERLGFHDFDASDHVILNDDPANYPAGAFRWDVESFWPDPFILLSAVGAVTSRIHLTTSILVAPLRPAAVIAKMASTLDNMTGGRLRLGIGSGWNRAEFDAIGVPYVGRTARMEDYVGACRALWTEAPASFASDTVSFEGMWCRPGPARPTGIPVLLGGPATPVAAARIAKLAEGWNPMDAQRDMLVDGIALIREAFAEAGRDPSSVVVRTPAMESIVQDAFKRDDPATLRDEVAHLAGIGVTDVKIYMSGVAGVPERVEETLTWVSSALGLEQHAEVPA